MQDWYPQDLVHLYEALEYAHKRRDRIAIAFIVYGGGLMLFAGLPARLWRLGGGAMFYITLTIGTLIMGSVGLWLLARLVTALKEIRDLREEIAYYKDTAPYTKKRKRRKAVQFKVGDDGELIPINHEQPDQRRMSL